MKFQLTLTLTLTLTLSIVFVLLLACNKKKEIVEPEANKNENLELIWEHVLSDPNKEYQSIDPVLYGDYIISSYYVPFSDSSEVAFALNKYNGEPVWMWDDYIRPGPQFIDGTDRIHVKDNLLIACSGQDNYVINMANGESVWATNIEDGNPRTSIFEDLLFHTLTYGSAPYGDSTKIIVAQILEGEWNNVYQLNKTNEYEVNFEAPAVYINEELDTLLIFQNRQIDLSTYQENIDFYCFNISTDSIVWIKNEFTSSGSSNVRVPIIDGNYLYFGGKWDYICLNLNTGEEVWRFDFYHTHQTSNYLLFSNLIIVNLDNGDLIALNKNTGIVEWSNEGLSGCCTELRIYNDRLYFANDKLFIVDPITGELLYKFSTPHPNGRFNSAIAVDLVNKRMYVTDEFYLSCFKLPD